MVGLLRYGFRLAPGLTAASMAVTAVAATLAVVQSLQLGRLPDALAGTAVDFFVALLFAFLLTVALAQVVRTPRMAFAEAIGGPARRTCCCASTG